MRGNGHSGCKEALLKSRKGRIWGQEPDQLFEGFEVRFHGLRLVLPHLGVRHLRGRGGPKLVWQDGRLLRCDLSFESTSFVYYLYRDLELRTFRTYWTPILDANYACHIPSKKRC